MSDIRREDWEILKPSVYGWGINDVNYPVTKSAKIDGKNKKVWRCPYYMAWASVVQRCHDPKFKEKQPTYKECTIEQDWQYLSNFIKWVDSQPNRNWQNCEVDKDFLIDGNKHYSPETVVFLPSNVNTFIINCNKRRGDLLIGVSQSGTKTTAYVAQCSDPFKVDKRGYVGVFPTELEAHKAWQAKKHEYACKLAIIQPDERVAIVLKELYAPDKDWTRK